MPKLALGLLLDIKVVRFDALEVCLFLGLGKKGFISPSIGLNVGEW